jgi:hypothetical protein
MFLRKGPCQPVYILPFWFFSPLLTHFFLIQKHAGSLLEGFTQTQISTIAVKDNFLVAGGFQGELTCKVS